LQLDIEPLVGATTIKMPLILQLIEKLLRDEFNDAFLLPNMDDFPILELPDSTLPSAVKDTCINVSENPPHSTMAHPSDYSDAPSKLQQPSQNNIIIDDEVWSSISLETPPSGNQNSKDSLPKAAELSSESREKNRSISLESNLSLSHLTRRKKSHSSDLLT
jgi:hypothetical protein